MVGSQLRPCWSGWFARRLATAPCLLFPLGSGTWLARALGAPWSSSPCCRVSIALAGHVQYAPTRSGASRLSA